MKNTKKHIPTTFVKMFKKHVRAKVEFFDDVGEIQIVPIDTIVDDGAPDLQADDLCRNQSQGFGARGKCGRCPCYVRGSAH